MNFEVATLLAEELTIGSRINRLCNILSEEIKNPVALSLTSETLIGHSSSFSSDFILEFTNSSRYMSKEELNVMHLSFDKIIASGKATSSAWPYLRHKQVNCGCMYKDSTLGVLLIPVVSTDVSEIDFDLVEYAARIFGMWLHINGYSEHYSPEQEFLKGILSGDIDPAHQRKNLSYINLSTIKTFRLIAFQPKSQENNSLEYQLAKLCKKYRRLWHTTNKGYIVVLMDASCTDCFPSFSALLEKNDAIACVSDEFSEFSEIKLHFDTTVEILRISILCKPTNRLRYADNYKLLYIFNKCKETAPAYMFRYEKLQKVIDYDAEHSTNYLKTLQIFFSKDGNYDEIAASLGLHRNTAFYRIKRIEELFDINLKDSLQFSSLFISLLSLEGTV